MFHESLLGRYTPTESLLSRCVLAEVDFKSSLASTNQFL